MDSETREMIGVLVGMVTALSPILALMAYGSGALTLPQTVLAIFAIPLVALCVGGWVVLSAKMMSLTQRGLERWGEN